MIDRPRIDTLAFQAETVNMKNITVSVPDEVYDRARARAAELHTSVSALVRRQLQELAGEESEFDRLRRMEETVRARLQAHGSGLSSSENLPREQLHDRNALC